MDHPQPSTPPPYQQPVFEVESYRKQFGDRIERIIDVPGVFAALPVLAPAIVVALVGLILWSNYGPTTLFFVTSIIAVLAAIAFGQTIALLMLTRRWLGTAGEILKILPEFLEKVAADAEAFESGTPLPADRAADIAVTAYDATLLPLMTEAVERVYGFVGSFASWVYRHTLSKLVRRTIGRMVTDSKDETRRQTAVDVLRRGEATGRFVDKIFSRLATPLRVAAYGLAAIALFFSGLVAFVLPLVVFALFG